MNQIIKLITTIILLCTPLVGHTYIGPGAGLSAIGSVLAFLGTLILLIIGFLWYPIKRLIKGKRGKDKTKSDGAKSDGES